jgi:carboxypeptidase C (cathepsin A)
VVVDGRTIPYTATAGLYPLLVNDTGERMGSMFFVAYVADRAEGEPPRPLTFVWNGGSVANSAQVHVVGFGPRRVSTGETYPEWGPDTETELVGHPHTWLSASDLVFVDPPGTGFSRATTEAFRDVLYTTRGDAEAVAEFIRLYLTRNDRWDAPLFIAGESYGTTRAMAVAEALERRRTRLEGVVLISGGYDVGQEMPDALRRALGVSELAAIGHHHGRLAPELQDLTRDEAVERAVDWAREVYAPALEAVDELGEDERDAVARGLHRFTGIDPEHVDRESLEIEAYTDNLLYDAGLEIGRYDGRMTTPHRGEDVVWVPFRDPSLAPMLDLMQGKSKLFNSYVRDTLGFRSDLLYRGPFGGAFHPEPVHAHRDGVASDWMTFMFETGPYNAQPADDETAPLGPWEASESFAPPLRQAMEMNPDLRVMNMKGMYDGSCAAMDEAVARSDAGLRERVRNHCYAGGHMWYSDLEPRVRAQRHFEAFVRDALDDAGSEGLREERER